MNNLKNGLVTLWRDEEGLTTVEYAIAGALISVAVAMAFKGLGTQVAAVLANIVTIISAGA
jgi:pilus assembly protein Flp/PilA